MARSRTSPRWLKEHFNDPCVKVAQRDGYGSRASYKLLEIQEKDRILCPGMAVVELGAGPGGWPQVTSRVTGDNPVDLVIFDMAPNMSGVRATDQPHAMYRSNSVAVPNVAPCGL